jgi:hypothetical protein
MLSSQEEQAERQRVFAQDQSVARQATTMHAHAIADAAMPRGRFSAVETAYVIGSKPDAASAYPPAAPQQRDPCGPEPPLGYRVDEMPHEPSSLLAPPDVAAPTDPTSAPSSPLARDVGSLSHSGDMTADGEQSRSQSDGYVRSPVRNYRRF